MRWTVFVGVWLAGVSVCLGQSREDKVRNDKAHVEADGFWIYNDFNKGIAEAKKTDKPLVVVLRCIPCEECVKLDEELVQTDPKIRPLLEKFVRVRLISTNGLDLSLFQFDTDQSFAVFFLNADKTIYGRYGTRSHRTHWTDDVSLAGLAKALEGALDLHDDFTNVKDSLAGKRGPKPPVARPELFPSLKNKYGPNLNYAGKVVPSCIHCHQIGDAVRSQLRTDHEPFPDTVLFPYPHPKSLGLILDPSERATITQVVADTPASAAGFKVGDQIRKINGQPILSLADIQWVLHHTPAEGGTLEFRIHRAGEPVEMKWKLDPGWRERDDFGWRVSTWGLRGYATGGLVLKPTTEEERKEAGVENMALRVEHVGQYGIHAAGKNAGFQKDDLIIRFDGRTDFAREADLIRHTLNHHQPGAKVAVTVLRSGKKVQLNLPIQ